ncbi:MAG: tRNA pseudouridine(38-40) synthase TruA [Lachnospiraceae bacterium]|nr:tRNA pseudouridine(38-40) synthase TruA [Lachnospiraceae bacterium]
MRRIKIIVAYDGTNYCGWQIQKNGLAIEEVLKKALFSLTGENITLIGASRTDSGVHALGNVAVFDTGSDIPPEKFLSGLNRFLPDDIVIKDSREVPLSWHPRYQNNIIKTYEYRIDNAKTPDPLKIRTYAHISFSLDLEQMRKGASYLLGTHDFICFCNTKNSSLTTVRTITDIGVNRNDDEIIIHVSGDGFLYNMVRLIAGTLIRIGRGFYEPEIIGDMLESKTRLPGRLTASAKGLVLVRIAYEKDEY